MCLHLSGCIFFLNYKKFRIFYFSYRPRLGLSNARTPSFQLVMSSEITSSKVEKKYLKVYPATTGGRYANMISLLSQVVSPDELELSEPTKSEEASFCIQPKACRVSSPIRFQQCGFNSKGSGCSLLVFMWCFQIQLLFKFK